MDYSYSDDGTQHNFSFNDEEEQRFYNCEAANISEFINSEGNFQALNKIPPLSRARTKHDLLPLRIRMMKDYAQSKINYTQIQNLQRLKKREGELMESCGRRREQQEKEQKEQNKGKKEQKENSLQGSRNNKSLKNSNVVSKSKYISLSRVSEKDGQNNGLIQSSYESMLSQNNEYFHRINESVMNRLLGIIESNQHKNTTDHVINRQISTNPQSLNDSRQIVINNIIPKREESIMKTYLNSKIKDSEQKIEKLAEQRKSFSYATPRGLKKQQKIHHYRTEQQNQQQESSIPHNFHSLHQEQQTLHIQTNEKKIDDPMSIVQVIERQQHQDHKVVADKRKREYHGERERNKGDLTMQANFEKKRAVKGMWESHNQNDKSLLEIEKVKEDSYTEYNAPTYRTDKNTLLEGPQTRRTEEKEEIDSKNEEESKLIVPSLSSQVNQIRKDLPKGQEVEKKAAVFMEIPIDEEENNKPIMSLAQAFRQKIGKLKSQSLPKKERGPKNTASPFKKKNNPRPSHARQTSRHQSQKQNKPSLDLSSLKGALCPSAKGFNSAFVTPKSNQPSEDLINRLIGGSKAKVSKKQMYALTKKNYENLPEVKQKKKQQKKKQLQAQRLERIKEYQRNIRSSKSTILSNN